MIIRSNKFERNRSIIDCVLRQGLTVTETARRFSLTQGRISQIVNRHLGPVDVQVSISAEHWEKIVEQARQRGTNARFMAAALLSGAVERSLGAPDAPTDAEKAA